MVYNELGRVPVSIKIKSRMVNFCDKVLNGKKEKLSYTLYSVLIRDWEKIPWIKSIKSLFDNTGMSIVWNHHFVNNSMKLMEVVETNLKDQFLQHWNSEMQESNKGKMYSCMKKNFGKEKYIDLLPSNL